MNAITIISIIVACLSLSYAFASLIRSYKVINKLKRTDADIIIEMNSGKKITFTKKKDRASTEKFIESMHALLNG